MAGSDHQPNYDPVQKITPSYAKEIARVNEESLNASKRIRVLLSAPTSYHKSAQYDTGDDMKAVHWEPISHENGKVDTESSRAKSTSTGRVTLTSREIPALSPGRSSPSTAVTKTDPITSEELRNGSFSPRTDEIQRKRTPGGLGVTIASSSPATNKAGFKELILSVVKIIYLFCNHKDGTPQAACQTILQSLKEGDFEEPKAPSTGKWSDGSTWKRMLDMGSSQ